VTRWYFDHNATTPVSARVLEVYTRALAEIPGNASSVHQTGQHARRALETARAQVARALRCDPAEVVFTSGGTEADNLAVLGVVRAARQPAPHVITTSIEHPAVLAACAQLEREGAAVTYLPVSGDGVVDPDDVRRAIRAGTVLISVMHANNETGVLQPVDEIAALAREHGIPMHSDGVQAMGKVPPAGGCDLYAMSGHKIFAPKGIGALRVRNGVRLWPLLYGGHHERDRRPGTENVPAAVALGEAVESLAASSTEQVKALRDRLEAAILDRVPGTRVNGGGAPRLPNTSNICFPGIGAEAMVIALDLEGFAVSTGSACSSGAVEPSHVLSAMGLSPAEARSSVRFSLGPSNTADQVDALVEAVCAVAERLRRRSRSGSVHA
jgi:cysteine desulfurase